MPDRSHRSARVVIMDDVSWSEPEPQARRGAKLAPPEWVAQPKSRLTQRHQSDDSPHADASSRADRPPTGSYHVEDYLDDDLDETVSRWRTELAQKSSALDRFREPEDEALWGPRPKLMPGEPGGRRTVVITGRVADGYASPRSAARGSRPMHARHGFVADRTAMWAVLLCVILLLVALTSH